MTIAAWYGDWPVGWLAGVLPVLHLLAGLAVFWHCLRYPRDPRSTLLWVFITWSFPVAGVLLYVTFGVNRVRERSWVKQKSDLSFGQLCRECSAVSQPLAYWRATQGAAVAAGREGVSSPFNTMMDRITPNHHLLGGNSLDILIDGEEAYPAMLSAIGEARHHIHVQTFILGADEIGRQMLDALAERARSGVRVRVLYDRFGSVRAGLVGAFNRWRRVPNMTIVGYTQANPLKRQLQVNLRNHRKIMVVDGRVAFTGGLNIRRDHVNTPGSPAIRDYQFAVRGPLIHELQYTFLRDWYFMAGEPAERLLAGEYFPAGVAGESPGGVAGRVINGGPTMEENDTLCDSFFAAVTAARSQVLVVTPYFVPPESLLRALRAAALRGVEVKILLSSVCNHRSVAFAARSFYLPLLLAGVRIFERRPPFIHAKAMVVDDMISIFGSANLDERSLKLNYESNVAVTDAGFAARLKRIVLHDFSLAAEVRLDEWRRRPWSRQMIENFFALMSPVL